MLTKSQQGNISVMATDRDVDVHGSYAITDHAAMMVNIGYVSRKNGDDNQRGNGLVGEVGAGYYTPITPDAPLFFDLYGGLGFGRIKSTIDLPVGNAELNYEVGITRFFAQPGIYFSSEYFNVGVNMRLIGNAYGKGKTTFTSQYLESTNFGKAEEQTLVFAEPALTIEGGAPKIKLMFQLGRSFMLSDVKDIDYDPTLVRLGVKLRF